MSDSKPESGSCCSHGEPRRTFLGASIAAGCMGAALGVAPAVPGLAVFLDPMLKGKKSADGGDKAEGKFLRVSTLDALPMDGTPVQVPVIADLTDVWNRESNQPIGAIYLRRMPNNDVKCFNAICPHAGCFVAFSDERNVFQCPCHTSSFELDGKAVQPSPSPRDLDELKVKVEGGEVHVEFVNYLPGKADRVKK